MVKFGKVYRCNVCGNILEMVDDAGHHPSCCGEKMEELIANTVDASKEKHVPVIEETKEGIIVRVGSVPHPMEESHYIMWVEVMTDDEIMRKYLKPGDKPEAKFCVKSAGVTARSYCTLHGLWQS